MTETTGTSVYKQAGVRVGRNEHLADLDRMRRESWANAWIVILQKTNRIVTGRRTSIKIAEDDENSASRRPPAWVEGDEVFFNRAALMSLSQERDIVTATLRLKGLNYHEVCHLLYSPSIDDIVAKKVAEKAARGLPLWLYAYNTLEDARIETWFTSVYGASARYFEASVMEWILRNGTAASAFQIYGRKYLTPKVRVRVGKAFVARYGEEFYEEFKSIMDSYLTVVPSYESNKALDLIMRFVTLLEEFEKKYGAQSLPPLLVDDNGGDGSGSHAKHPGTPGGLSKAGKQTTGRREQMSARDAAMDALEDALDADAEFEAEESMPSSQAGVTEATADGGGGAGASVGQVGNTEPEPPQSAESAFLDAVDAAEDALNDIREDDAIREDVGRMADALKAAMENAELEALSAMEAEPTRKMQSAPAQAVMAVRKTHDVLSRIRGAAEPETLFRQVHGRIDARRLAGRREGDIDLFRSYNAGFEEEVEVEAVLLVDRSGSMQGLMIDASNALWSLKRAMDKLDIPTTVMLFSDPGRTRIAYKGREKAPAQVRHFGAAGGTDPEEALNYALRVFYKSQAANKVLITITDGSWGESPDRIKTQMKTMKRMGVTSMLLGLQQAAHLHGLHHHDMGFDLSNIGQLPKAATQLVSGILHKAEARH